ncbi:DUF883 family protein [Niveispirillum sp. KHB5.9]|uniref:DUF883 family protein n=1 Tax=Niveispirillum sp. KHB5.9 TaxID=3400269 RepID=UPI003A866276
MASVQSDTIKSGNGAAAAGDIEAQLKQLRADLTSLASTVAAAGSEKADGYKARVGEMASNVKDASVTAIQNLREELVSLEKKVEGGVRERPLQSLGIAVVAGFALALLARR